ncbi:sensor histidine kinase [Allochromatium vinosum]|uniref:histidine kinase n=1 Tax=Allochromatium vinosum (strain ATCC 17899 / DSM 180 / NBRC 103801 / NCIMB 10441 / D) TaxID=572477 RepID=D3RPC3_ALLVD|nr:ATP-binding protein [Allochromatium vinosum]ADC63513.1 integral membrane sensor signal transduction histidine kinase [Allochromatium vinosum DSM 180]
MGIKAKLKLIGLLPLLVAIVFGVTIYRGQDRLNALSHLALKTDAMREALRDVRDVSRLILATRDNAIRREGYDALEIVNRGMADLAVWRDEPGLGEIIHGLERHLLMARIHYEMLDGLTVPMLKWIAVPQISEVEQNLMRELDALDTRLRALHQTARAALVEHSERLWRREFWLLTLTAVLVLWLTHPILDRIGTALHTLTQGTRRIGPNGLPKQLDLTGEDEFGQLARDFNTMVRRLAESEVARAERSRDLEAAVQDLENFSYSVSHDLRAPLRAIDGFIGILREDYAANLDAEGLRLFGVVSANARKMERLIDDILALSRAGRLAMEWVTVDMNQMVDEVWSDLLETASGRPIQFQRADLPNCQGDPRAIRQIWQNLLGNALKFTRDRDPARIQVSARAETGCIRYSVEDNGAGFDPAYSAKLFCLFQRLHGVDEFEGTGVGLAIVKRFVQRHHGQVEAGGAVNGGAVFAFSLPIDPESFTAAANAEDG